MIGKIFHISNHTASSYPMGTWEQFKSWFLAQKSYQIDIETDITDWWCTRKLISIQFGSCTADRVQWFLQWSQLSAEQRDELIEILNNDRRLKLAHSGQYEYIIMRFYGVILENFYDTMLCEKVLQGGLETEDYALADISWKYLRIRMNKAEQTNFGDDIINDSKILYAITDVAYLDNIKWQQIQDGSQKDLLNVMALENEVMPAFGDITYEGLLMDKEKWRENLRWAEGELIPIIEKLNEWLKHKDIAWLAVESGYISPLDRVMINYNSHQQRTELLKLVFPDLIGGTMAVVAKYVRDNAHKMIADMGEEPAMHLLRILDEYYSKNYVPLQNELLDKHSDYLITRGYLIPAGESTINWNSSDQALPLAQCLVPKLKGLSEEERDKHVHPFLKDYGRFKEFNKLCNDMGERFIREYVGPDGKVRTSFSQVKSTGRVSSKDPNMQNITVRESVGTRYRNAFVAEEGWEFVSSDYISQELVFIAVMSGEPAWIETLKAGKDLHSVLAEVVYGTKWKEAAEANCEYYKMEVGPDGKLQPAHLKCNCKKHKPLRYNVKTVNFMLAYGGTEFKLSSELEISLREAKALISLYFSKLPRVKALFAFLSTFVLTNGYAMTLAPFFRKRWFPYWKENLPWLGAHMQDIKYNSTLGDIEKAGMNHPIQGGSADTTKVALILIRSYIRDNNLWDNIRLAMQIHDSVDTKRRKIPENDFWSDKLRELMEQAGKVIISNGMLKADVVISPMWTK